LKLYVVSDVPKLKVYDMSAHIYLKLFMFLPVKQVTVYIDTSANEDNSFRNHIR